MASVFSTFNAFAVTAGNAVLAKWTYNSNFLANVSSGQYTPQFLYLIVTDYNKIGSGNTISSVVVVPLRDPVSGVLNTSFIVDSTTVVTFPIVNGTEYHLMGQMIYIDSSNEMHTVNSNQSIVMCSTIPQVPNFSISPSTNSFIIQLLNDYYELPFFYLLKDNNSSNCFIFVLRNFINFTGNTNQKPEIPIELPKIDYIDLRPKFNEIFDQGKIGSCTANALTSIFEYDKPNFKGSRLFLYYNERLYINETNKDEGAYLSDGIISLKSYGICEEKYHPYIISNVFKEPSKEAYEKAKKNYLIEGINIPNEIPIIKYWLNKNEPIALGIAIYSNFVNFSSARNGKIGLPTIDDKFIGGHAVILCGYNDNTKEFILRNSWGSYWGENGYFYLPYSYITNKDLCGDLWIITKIKSI